MIQLFKMCVSNLLSFVSASSSCVLDLEILYYFRRKWRNS